MKSDGYAPVNGLSMYYRIEGEGPPLVYISPFLGVAGVNAVPAHNRDMLRFDAPPTPESKCFQFQRESYESVAAHPEYWSAFWRKGAGLRWDGFSGEELASVRAPILIALGDHDFVRVEHAVQAFRRLPNAELAIVPTQVTSRCRPSKTACCLSSSIS